MNVTLAAAIDHVLPPIAALRDDGQTSFEPLLWVLPLALVAMVPIVHLVAGKRLGPQGRPDQVAGRVSNPLVAFVLGVVVVGGWRLSPQAVSVVAVAVMIAFELGQSLPAEHRYRQLADGLTAPLVAIATVVVLLSGLQLAQIIGFMQ